MWDSEVVRILPIRSANTCPTHLRRFALGANQIDPLGPNPEGGQNVRYGALKVFDVAHVGVGNDAADARVRRVQARDAGLRLHAPDAAHGRARDAQVPVLDLERAEIVDKRVERVGVQRVGGPFAKINGDHGQLVRGRDQRHVIRHAEQGAARCHAHLHASRHARPN